MDVFIVDDNRGMRMMVKHCLNEAGFMGHTIKEFENGLDALNGLETLEPQLILSDWNMPKMTGLEFLLAMKAKVDNNEWVKMIPFVFVTSESTPSMMQQARQAGAVGFISKPFTPDIFERKLAPFFDD